MKEVELVGLGLFLKYMYMGMTDVKLVDDKILLFLTEPVLEISMQQMLNTLLSTG